MTAKLYNFEAERLRRGKGEEDICRIFKGLENDNDLDVPDETLVKWAYELARSDDKTLPQIVDEIEAELRRVKSNG